MIGRASASCLFTTGSSISWGSRPRTRETISRTSWAASSIGRSRLNSRLMLEDCSELLLVMVRRPSSEASCSSSTSVTADSMTAGLAPRSVTDTETIGGSTSGNSRTESSLVPEDAEQHQRAADHAGEDRPLDGDVGEFHAPDRPRQREAASRRAPGAIPEVRPTHPPVETYPEAR